MKISKRQLKRIIREEHSKIKTNGFISEMQDGKPHTDRMMQNSGDDISDMFDAGQTDYYEGQYGDSLPSNVSPEMKSAYDDGYATGKHEDTYADNYEPEDYLRPYGKSIRTTPMGESMKLTKSQLKRIIKEEYSKLKKKGFGNLNEAPGEGLNDPEVAAAYEDLQGGFAPDTDFSFLDDWPYTEALEILQDEEYERRTRDDPPEDYEDDGYYDDIEEYNPMIAQKNRNMYESFHPHRNVSFPFTEIADEFQERGYKVKKANAGDTKGHAIFHLPMEIPGGSTDLGYYVDVKYDYGTFFFYWYLKTKESPSSPDRGRIKMLRPGGGKPRWEAEYRVADLKIVIDEIDYEINVHEQEGTHPFDLGLPPSKFAYRG